MKETQKKFIWWWGWNPDPLESELEEQAKRGWVIDQVDPLCIWIRFRKGTPQQRRFATDYQPEASKDYLEIFQADGWHLEWTGANGWYLFSKAYTDERPEIFTDNTSLIEKNNRILKVLLPLFIMLIVLFITIVLPILNEPFYVGLYVFALGLYTYIFTQVWLHNRKLKIDI